MTIISNQVSRREANRFLVVNCLRQKRKLSRSDLAKELGISRPAITNIVAELMEVGYIRECGVNEAANRGRKPVLLELNNSAASVIGVNLKGDDRIEASVVNLDCEVIHHIERSSTEMTSSNFMAEVQAGVKQLLAEADIPRKAISGIGVGVPAIIDQETGCVICCAFNPDWEGVPLGMQLQQALELPIYIENIPNTAALGEWWYGNAAPRRDFIYVWVERGVGCGIIANGELYRGARGAASQFGHTIVQADGPRCRCGLNGCVEAFASETAVLDYVASQMRIGQPTQMKEVPQHLQAVYGAANNNDALARQAVRRMGHYLGIGIANLINLFDPETIIIGGGVWRVIDQLLEEVRVTVSRNAIGIEGRDINIIPSSLGGRTGLVGAATLALEGLFQVPVFETPPIGTYGRCVEL